MATTRRKKAAGPRKQRQVKRQKAAVGKKAAVTKVLTAAKRSAAGKKAAVTKALTAAQRKAVGERMKKYWEERRAGAAKTARKK